MLRINFNEQQPDWIAQLAEQKRQERKARSVAAIRERSKKNAKKWLAERKQNKQ